MDLRYLLLGDIETQRSKAVRVRLYAAWDLLTYSSKLGGSAGLDQVRTNILELGRENPVVAAAVEAEWRGKSPSHWSGKSRVGAMREINPDPRGNLHDYKWLSWMSHPIMGPVIDLQTVGERREFADPFGQESTARIMCRKATRVVMRSWRLVNDQRWFQEREVDGTPG